MLSDGNHSSPASTDDRLPTRQTLLDRLKDWSDNTSWQTFFDTYWRLIYNVGLKAGLTEAEAEEVVQETVISVAKGMKDFQYDPARGSFKGWLLQLTGWRITNQFRKRRVANTAHSSLGGTELHAPTQLATTESRVPPELERLWDSEWEETLLATALGRVRSKVNPKHFQIFELCVVQQKPIKAIREFLGVSAMEVYLARHRVGRLVQREVEKLRKGLL